MAKHPGRFSGGKERRKSERCSCHQGTCCRVIDPETSHLWPGGIWNISLGGISLLLQPRFEPGRVLTVELWHTARKFFCRLDMEVKYSGLCLPNGAWLHGCAFSRPLQPEEFAALV
jgi:PilZ domain